MKLSASLQSLCFVNSLLFASSFTILPSQLNKAGLSISEKAFLGKSERYFFNFGGNKQEEPAPKEEVKPKSETKNTNEDEIFDPVEDAVESVFTFFFGKKEEEPMGLKRFGKERFPEQYPATIDEWADPIESDNKEVAILRPMLKNTNFEERGLTLSYNANRNGWSAAAFHKALDKKGPALVVCTTTEGLLCGGYNPKGWVGYGEARGSIAAFLFAYNDGVEALPTKLRKVGGKSLAQQDMPETGPQFGADSLIIPLGGDNPKLARSKLGSYYERYSDGTNSLFGYGKAAVQLKDLKVYTGVYEKDEYIPFTDAEPFALY